MNPFIFHCAPFIVNSTIETCLKHRKLISLPTHRCLIVSRDVTNHMVSRKQEMGSNYYFKRMSLQNYQK